MEFENILFEVNGKIAKITINRPKYMNALNKQTFVDLENAMNEVYNNFDIKGVIITGSGEKSFVAGADIKEFAQFTPEQGEELSRNGMRIFKMIEESPKPVIAAINGFALGGGLEFALACDFRFASKTAKVKDKERQVTVGLPETSLGVIPGAGGTQRLARLIGPKKALFYISQAAQMTTEEAYNLGIIEKLFETDEEMNEAALKFAKSLAKKATYAIGCAKRAIYDGVNETLEVGLKFEAQEFYNCFESDDSSEGFNAFIEKRKPDFKGK